MEEQKTTRHNQGKNKLELIPPEWTDALGWVFTFGATKYAPHNWKRSLNTSDHATVKDDRMGSALRHISAYRSGEINDPESKQHHLVQAAWNLLFVFWYDLNAKPELKPIDVKQNGNGT